MRLAVIVEVPFVVCRIVSNERQLYFLPWFSDGATFACQWTSSRAREAGLHSFSAFLWNMICSFSWSKIRNVFCAGKNWNYICQKWHAVQWVEFRMKPWICSNSSSCSIFVQLFDLFVFRWFYWTIEQGAILAQACLAWSDFALPPSPVCLLCSVLSTCTCAVLLACTMPSEITWFVALWEGRKVGRNTSMAMDVSEPPNPFGLYMKICWSSLLLLYLFWL